MFGLIALITGIICLVFDIGGSAKLELESIGVVLVASAGVVLIALGIFFMYLGI
jgi:hypothetical protein